MSERDSTKTMRIDIRPDAPGIGPLPVQADSIPQPPIPTTSPGANSLERQTRGREYQRLLQSIYDGVLVTDAKGRILDFNSRTLDFFQYDEHELLEMSVVNLISGADSSLLAAIRRNLQNHKYTLIEARCRRRDKTMFPAEIAVNRIDLDDVGQLCFLMRDISVRKKTQEELEEAVARLQEHDRAKSQFVSNVSHELRTPLTSMIYAVGNMLRGVVGPLPDRVRQYLDMLDNDCRRLLATVNDILDLRRIEAKSLPLNRVRFPLPWLIRRSAESMRVQAEHKGLTLTISVEDGNFFVHCDPRRIERVVLNVVGNAIKFTARGGDVRVSVGEDRQRSGYAMVSVQDNGVGIPPEAVDKVTMRYFTVGDQPTGTGLGLSISKEIIELHGGNLDLRSPPPDAENGTVAYISLPLAESPLVVVSDADDMVRDLMARQLQQQGYRVVTAINAASTIEQVRAHKPDLVIVDLDVAQTEGQLVVLEMSREDEMMRIPIVAVVGSRMGREQLVILRSLSVPTIAKPWQESELFEQICHALERKATRDQMPLLRVPKAAADKGPL